MIVNIKKRIAISFVALILILILLHLNNLLSYPIVTAIVSGLLAYMLIPSFYKGRKR